MSFVKPEDQSFDNPALRGSGTNLPEGGIGPNLPDPTEVSGVFVPDETPRTGRIQGGEIKPTAPSATGVDGQGTQSENVPADTGAEDRGSQPESAPATAKRTPAKSTGSSTK